MQQGNSAGNTVTGLRPVGARADAITWTGSPSECSQNDSTLTKKGEGITVFYPDFDLRALLFQLLSRVGHFQGTPRGCNSEEDPYLAAANVQDFVCA